MVRAQVRELACIRGETTLAVYGILQMVIQRGSSEPS
jgi:hypothetical protein